ncbi:MAG: hypothetical protein ABFD54_12915 [Armatimonadota bacterium]
MYDQRLAQLSLQLDASQCPTVYNVPSRIPCELTKQLNTITICNGIAGHYQLRALIRNIRQATDEDYNILRHPPGVYLR